jgi:uncharacterized protein (TIGR00299 family) protein
MMHVHLDAVGGIAGDMFAAAMLDAFPDLVARVMGDVSVIVPPMAGIPRLTSGASAAIACKRFGLEPGFATALGGPRRGRRLERFADLRTEIADADLSPGTADAAIAILTLMAEAESQIHGLPIEDVHFHELADWDSVLDVVAAGSISAGLGADRWSISSLPRGAGLVSTQHGLLPVPAPATTLLLTGFEFRDDGIGGERVTPTGAAIVKFLAPKQTGGGEGRLVASGTGAGTRELRGLPNILRVLAFDDFQARTDRVSVIAFEVDDMTGEEIGAAVEALRGLAGVLDVSLVAMSGKKHRPVTGFRLIVRPDAAEMVGTACFAMTSTIGLRVQDQMRRVLPRSEDLVDGVGIKRVERPGRERTVKAESDDITGLSLAARRRTRRRIEGGGP